MERAPALPEPTQRLAPAARASWHTTGTGWAVAFGVAHIDEQDPGAALVALAPRG